MEHEKQRFTWNLNLSSLAIGFLLALCLLLVIGATGNNNRSGRYQCCAAGNNEVAVFVIDTETGQTWRFSRTDTYNFGTPDERKSIRSSIIPLVE